MASVSLINQRRFLKAEVADPALGLTNEDYLEARLVLAMVNLVKRLQVNGEKSFLNRRNRR